jgi:hypothetical protein
LRWTGFERFQRTSSDPPLGPAALGHEPALAYVAVHRHVVDAEERGRLLQVHAVHAGVLETRGCERLFHAHDRIRLAAGSSFSTQRYPVSTECKVLRQCSYAAVVVKTWCWIALQALHLVVDTRRTEG